MKLSSSIGAAADAPDAAARWVRAPVRCHSAGCAGCAAARGGSAAVLVGQGSAPAGLRPAQRAFQPSSMAATVNVQPAVLPGRRGGAPPRRQAAPALRSAGAAGRGGVAAGRSWVDRRARRAGALFYATSASPSRRRRDQRCGALSRSRAWRPSRTGRCASRTGGPPRCRPAGGGCTRAANRSPSAVSSLRSPAWTAIRCWRSTRPGMFDDGTEGLRVGQSSCAAHPGPASVCAAGHCRRRGRRGPRGLKCLAHNVSRRWWYGCCSSCARRRGVLTFP